MALPKRPPQPESLPKKRSLSNGWVSKNEVLSGFIWNYLLNWIVCSEKFRQTHQFSDMQSHAEARSCNHKVMQWVRKICEQSLFSTTRGVLNGITTAIRWKAWSIFFWENRCTSRPLFGPKQLGHLRRQRPLPRWILSFLVATSSTTQCLEHEPKWWVGWDFKKKLKSKVEV